MMKGLLSKSNNTFRANDAQSPAYLKIPDDSSEDISA
jgi:hypothetical protein